MAHKCLDCGNNSSKQFPGGRCPACDSFNVRTDKKTSEVREPRPKNSTFQRFLLIGLWALVAYGIWDNYL